MAKRKITKNEPKRVLTREERIQNAWEMYKLLDGEMDLIPPVPACRLLEVGTKVELGNLKDCVVAELSEDGRLVLVEHTRVESNYGNPISTEGCFCVWPWFDVFPLDMIEETAFASDRLRPHYLTGTVSSLCEMALRQGLIDNPDYQRDYVWTLEDKQRLIESVMLERNIDSFIFVKYPFEKYKGRNEILDGKQRLNALVEFYTSQYPYKGRFYHQLSARDRNRFESLRITYGQMDGERMSRAELLSMFLETNTGGVPQTEEHLEKVRTLLEAELNPGQ